MGLSTVLSIAKTVEAPEQSSARKPRTAKASRPQTTIFGIDASFSMKNPPEKAAAATEGVQEAIMEAQTMGTPGSERTYFRFTLFEFAEDSELIQPFDAIPVRQVDPDDYTLTPNGAMTNITAFLEAAKERVRTVVDDIKSHPESNEHPLPLVILVTDGCHNTGPSPEAVAEEIKAMEINGEHVTLAVAGVAVGNSDLDEPMMHRIASEGCYMRIEDVAKLREFLAVVGSSTGGQSRLIKDLERR